MKRDGYMLVGGADLIPSPDSAIAAATAPLDAWMGKACMYCRLVFEVVPCAERERGGITHGVCYAPECRARLQAQRGEAREVAS